LCFHCVMIEVGWLVGRSYAITCVQPYEDPEL